MNPNSIRTITKTFPILASPSTNSRSRSRDSNSDEQNGGAASYSSSSSSSSSSQIRNDPLRLMMIGCEESDIYGPNENIAVSLVLL